jgi:hypothetical protein
VGRHCCLSELAGARAQPGAFDMVSQKLRGRERGRGGSAFFG